jgi:hypothetical protein
MTYGSGNKGGLCFGAHRRLLLSWKPSHGLPEAEVVVFADGGLELFLILLAGPFSERGLNVDSCGTVACWSETMT